MSAQHQTIKAPVAVKTSRTSRPEIVETVADVIADIRANGDAAVRRWSQKFDNWSPESYRLGPDQIASVVSSVPETVLDDLRFVGGVAGGETHVPGARRLAGPPGVAHRVLVQGGYPAGGSGINHARSRVPLHQRWR